MKTFGELKQLLLKRAKELGANIYTRGIHKVSVATFACGSATVEACGNSYIRDCRGGIKPQSDYAIVKRQRT